MNISQRFVHAAHANQRVVLRFAPRASDMPCLAFPCNAAGDVEMDDLSEQQRNDYLFARALRGRDYASPVVELIAA
jgi:hypothetical protein